MFAEHASAKSEARTKPRSLHLLLRGFLTVRPLTTRAAQKRRKCTTGNVGVMSRNCISSCKLAKRAVLNKLIGKRKIFRSDGKGLTNQVEPALVYRSKQEAFRIASNGFPTSLQEVLTRAFCGGKRLFQQVLHVLDLQTKTAVGG